MNIADKLLTIAENTKALKSAKKSVSGAMVQVNDVSEDTHEVEISFTSDTLTDFTDTYVMRCGKNLIQHPEIVSNNNKIICDVDTTGTVSLSAENPLSKDSTIFVLGNSTNRLNLELTEDMVLFGCPKGSNGSDYRLMAYVDPPAEGDPKYPQDAGNGVMIHKGGKLIYVYISLANNLAITDKLVFKPCLCALKDFRSAPANKSGVVNGITSISPDMTLTSYADVIINAKYNRANISVSSEKITELNEAFENAKAVLQEVT